MKHFFTYNKCANVTTYIDTCMMYSVLLFKKNTLLFLIPDVDIHLQEHPHHKRRSRHHFRYLHFGPLSGQSPGQREVQGKAPRPHSHRNRRGKLTFCCHGNLVLERRSVFFNDQLKHRFTSINLNLSLILLMLYLK